MREIRIAAAQFENRNGDKAYNLAVMRVLAARAAAQGAEAISFHEVCIPAYTFVRRLSVEQLVALAEPVPDGPSVGELRVMAREFGMAILAGLLERDERGRVYNTYVCVNRDGLVASFRKLHTFIHPYLTNGERYCVFDLGGVRCGILICYDNNVIENVRCTALLGAEVIFMPHVTCCVPSSMPGRGLVDRALWENREHDPVRLRQEFDGPKGRGWLLRWLPARAYDNGVYVVFTNPVGLDDDQIRNGNSMILDPYGEILAECRHLGDDVVTATCTPAKLADSHGRRYLRARRPGLYAPLTEASQEQPVVDSGWGHSKPAEA